MGRKNIFYNSYVVFSVCYIHENGLVPLIQQTKDCLSPEVTGETLCNKKEGNITTSPFFFSTVCSFLLFINEKSPPSYSSGLFNCITKLSFLIDPSPQSICQS